MSETEEGRTTEPRYQFKFSLPVASLAVNTKIKGEDRKLEVWTRGETDLHISRETIRPGWWGYAMRENAPFRGTINKWFGFSKRFKVVSYKTEVLILLIQERTMPTS